MVRATRISRSVPRPLARSSSARWTTRRDAEAFSRRRREAASGQPAVDPRARSERHPGRRKVADRRDPPTDDRRRPRAPRPRRAPSGATRGIDDPEVDPVAKRTRDAPLVALGTQRRARARAIRRPGEPARARVHRGDQLEPRREDGRPAGPGDRHPPFLERLPERLEHVAIELGQLVEEEDALVGQRDLARRQARSAADHGGIRDRVVRRTERRASAQARRSVPRRRPTRRRSPPALRHHRAAAAARGWSERAASCRIRAARSAAVHDRPRARSRARAAPRPGREPRPGPGPRVPDGATVRPARGSSPPADPTSSTRRRRGHGSPGRPGADERRPHRGASSTPSTSIPSTSRASSTASGGDDHAADPATRQGGDHRQDARDRPHLAAERQLADQRQPSSGRADLLRAEQDPHRHREVERRAGLALVGRREVDRDPARRMDEAGVAQGAADPFARLLERGVGQPDDREPGQPGRDIDLDPDEPAIEAVERRGWDDGQHAAP